MHIFLNIILWLLMGLTTAYFATQRKRDALGWFMIGILLGFLGLLLLFLLPKLKEKEEIGKTDPLKLAPVETNSLSTIPNPALASQDLYKEWYFYDRSKQLQGPVDIALLKKIWQEGLIDKDTFIWSEGREQWNKIEEIEHLQQLLEAT